MVWRVIILNGHILNLNRQKHTSAGGSGSATQRLTPAPLFDDVKLGM